MYCEGLIPTCVHWYKSHMGSLASYLIGELFLRAQVGMKCDFPFRVRFIVLYKPLLEAQGWKEGA